MIFPRARIFYFALLFLDTKKWTPSTPSKRKKREKEREREGRRRGKMEQNESTEEKKNGKN